MSEAPGLPDFLLARIAEDERASRAAATVDGADVMLAALPTLLFGGLRVAFPARVLAECAAKRRIVARFGWSGEIKGTVEWDTLCDLAAPYVDHPDYRQEWKP